MLVVHQVANSVFCAVVSVQCEVTVNIPFSFEEYTDMHYVQGSATSGAQDCPVFTVFPYNQATSSPYSLHYQT